MAADVASLSEYKEGKIASTKQGSKGSVGDKIQACWKGGDRGGRGRREHNKGWKTPTKQPSPDRGCRLGNEGGGGGGGEGRIRNKKK